MIVPSPQPNVLMTGGETGLSRSFWALLVATGIGAGFAGGLLMVLLRATQHLVWGYSGGTFLPAVQHASDLRRVLALAAAGLLAGCVGWALRQGPGGHAGELTEAIWFRSGRMPPLRTTARALLSIVIVGMGASLGRESAPKQAGAALASLLSARFGLDPAESRLLAACGAGAGMAAVYNVPLGGALFAVEVLLGSLALPLVAPALVAALLAVACSWTLLPIRPTYAVPHFGVSLASVVWAVPAGPLIGLAAVVYIRVIVRADRLRPQGVARLVAPVLVFAALGAAAIAFPQLLGNGRDAVQRAFLDEVALPLLAALLVLKPLATAACLGSGAPGGLFTPTMTAGAMLGGLLGHLFRLAWPGGAPGGAAIIGAGAMLAASTLGPVSSLVLVLEMTHRIDAMMVPLMLATAGAVLTTRVFESRSIYSGRIHAGRAAASPARPSAPVAFARLLGAPHATISAAAQPAETLRALLGVADEKGALFVLDERGTLLGAIDPQAARRARPLIETAGDLARPVAPLLGSMSEAEVMRRLRAADGAVLPVLDGTTRRLIGAASLDGRG